MDNNFILPFIESTRNVFETMFHLEVAFEPPEVRDTQTPSHDVSATIRMSGDVEGTVVLSLPFETARRVAVVFTGCDGPLSTEDMSDAIGEVASMIAGGAKSQFDGKNVSNSCPSVVMGLSHPVYGGKDVVTIAIPCSCDCGEFTVEVATHGSASGSGVVGAAKVAA